jgi:hypothetical protein
MAEWWDVQEEELAESFGASYADLPRPENPGMREFPSDLSEITGEALSRQMTYLAALIGHAEYRLSLLEATRAGLKMRYDIAAASEFVAYGTKMAANEKARRLLLLPKLKVLHESLLEADQHCMVLKALVAGYGTKMQAVSRELTRRVAEMRRSE